ncbi:unnamed protein product [Symbiodinium natans]|uniref:RING-type domain-containing protein n=1 Tax=Symbiodinium natans TaxID=878477 RepID=A0A812LZW9_9DINO|nr:unnamed protein product [Symbiodinium natans]
MLLWRCAFVPEEGNENDLPDEAEEAEPEMCVICHDCMLADDVLLRLVCGHVYHHDCCLRWANAAGMAQADADMPCPMRCHLARVANAANPNAGNANPANPNDADNGLNTPSGFRSKKGTPSEFL